VRIHFALLACALLLPVPAALAADPTECDRVASHPDDPGRAAPGVERSAIDLPAALATCEAELRRDPTNARTRYQVARLLFYSGDSARAVAEMRTAADAGYPQAAFVYGTFISRGRENAPGDICLAERYWLQSARGGRQAARVQYVRFALKGRFAGCKAGASHADMTNMMSVAATEARDFYERLLIEDLSEALLRAAPAPTQQP
jgi:TPR repeat protein